MIIEIIFALVFGVIVGTVTGLTPGIHINLIAGLTLANLGLFSGFSPLSISVFIASLSVTHIFIDFIPSIFLGAPDEDSILAILPGHKMLKAGKGGEAVALLMQGSLVALILGAVFIPVYILFLAKMQAFIQNIIPYILIWVSLYIVLREKNPTTAFFSFALAGILGFVTFNMPIKEPLLPLLTGLFGLAGITTSIASKEKIPTQMKTNQTFILKKTSYLKSIGISSIIGPIFSFLPGIGSSHVSIVSAEIVKHDRREFLFLNGIAATFTMILSFIAVYVIGKTRTGSAATIKELLGTISFNSLFIIIISSIIAGVIAYIIGVNITHRANFLLSKVNYARLNIIVLLILVVVNIFLTNALGILILSVSTALGIWTIRSGIKRINLMGSLLIPTILYYLAY